VQNHLTTEVQERMADVAKTNGTLLHSLAKKLKGQLVDELKMDLMTDINALEAALAKELPGGLELLSFTHEYAQVAMFARDLKDTRMILMQLILSLPEVKK